MLIKARFRFSELLLGILLSVAIFAIGMTFGSSRHQETDKPTDKAAAQIQTKHKPEPFTSDWLTEDGTVFFTAALVFVAGIQALLFVWQLVLIQRSLKPAERAADAARAAAEHVKAVERAFAKMSGCAPGIVPDISGLFWMKVSVKNFGRTPATISDIVLNRVVVPHGDPLPQVPQYERQDGQITGGFLVANEEMFFERFYQITREEMAGVRDLQSDLYLIGYLDYRDQFGVRHRAGYARVYRPLIDDRASYRSDNEYEARTNLVFVRENGYNYDRLRLPEEGNDWD
jgi:hypothetical protein